jgi:hypothetical protein
VKEGSLFVNNILIATNNSENCHNKEGELNNSIYINRVIAGDKILKNTYIFKGIISY